MEGKIYLNYQQERMKVFSFQQTSLLWAKTVPGFIQVILRVNNHLEQLIMSR